MAFQQAVKSSFSLKLAIAGIAGVGKTYTSFQLATELSEGQRFAVIDTENGKSLKYADEFAFDVSLLDVFSLSAYIKEIKLAEQMGYKVLVIDGLSQLWSGKGGVKEMVEMIAKRDRITTFSAWQTGNAMLVDFVKLILDSKMHIICTLRSKTEYGSETSDKGKLQYKRLGMAPEQKDNLEFEFDLFAEMDTEHNLIFQKSLCRKLSRKILPMEQEGEAKRLVALLRKWMTGEKPVDQVQGPATQANEPVEAATESQLSSIRKLYERLGKDEPEHGAISYQEAKALIAQLSEEYKQSRTSEPVKA